MSCTRTLQQPGIKLPTLQLVNNLLYLLSHSQNTKSVLNFEFSKYVFWIPTTALMKISWSLGWNYWLKIELPKFVVWLSVQPDVLIWALDPNPPPNLKHSSSNDLYYCHFDLQVSGLTSEIYICFHARVHLCEDFLEVIADSCQNGSVGRVWSPIRPQGNVTEHPRLPLASQLAQHVSAMRCPCLCDTASANQLLKGNDRKTRKTTF